MRGLLRGPSCCNPLVDINCDGIIDPDDLADYIACYVASPPSLDANFNGDAWIDPDDLSDFIAAYFNPPC